MAIKTRDLSFCLCLAVSLGVHAAEVISANGYSGLGLVPSPHISRYTTVRPHMR